jgi:hypothetical protein
VALLSLSSSEEGGNILTEGESWGDLQFETEYIDQRSVVYLGATELLAEEGFGFLGSSGVLSQAFFV